MQVKSRLKAQGERNRQERLAIFLFFIFETLCFYVPIYFVERTSVRYGSGMGLRAD